MIQVVSNNNPSVFLLILYLYSRLNGFDDIDENPAYINKDALHAKRVTHYVRTPREVLGYDLIQME